ncbi:MAG: hypothetical protein LBF66_01620 [Holosporales bacterium]|nr:hypothetical protein [Holosporales bacterium]
MKSNLRPIFILSGTAIGSGMISLPLVLAHIGIFPSILIMGICAFMTYISALIRTELNLHSNCRFTLELVGLEFSGKGAALCGKLSLRLLQFSLLSAYIYGLSTVLCAGSQPLKVGVALGVFLLLVFSSPRILDINKKLFFAFIVVILFAIACMVAKINFAALPQSTHAIEMSRFCVILPTLFTSFGFQGSLHSITNCCNNDPKMIKSACLWGSIIPALIYSLWVIGVFALIFSTQPVLFEKMATQGIDIDELIKALGLISNASFIKATVLAISILAIGTSIVGVGLALVEDLELSLESSKFKLNKNGNRAVSAALSVVPALLVALLVPNAFVGVLSFAGMILSVIAIFLPTFLLFKINKPLEFSILKRKELIGACVVFGGLIVLCELGGLLWHR